MRVFYLLVIVLFNHYMLSAQHGMSIDALIGPDYSFRHLLVTSKSQAINAALKTRKQEKAKIKYRVGINLNLRLIGNTWFKTGLRYVNAGYVLTDKKDLKWAGEHDGMGGCILNPELPHELKLTKTHHFIEMPLHLRRDFGADRLIFFGEIGISPLLYLRTSDRTTTEFTTMKSSTDHAGRRYSRFYYSINLAFGAAFSLSPSSKIFAQPTFRYHAPKLEDVPIREHLYGIGLEFGFRKELREN